MLIARTLWSKQICMLSLVMSYMSCSRGKCNNMLSFAIFIWSNWIILIARTLWSKQICMLSLAMSYMSCSRGKCNDMLSFVIFILSNCIMLIARTLWSKQIYWRLRLAFETHDLKKQWAMMTSSNGNLIRVTGDRPIPRTKASYAELWFFLWSAPDQKVEQTFEMPMIWDGIVLIITLL